MAKITEVLSKDFYLSKINVIALATTVAGVMTYLTNDEWVKTNPELVKWLLTASGTILFIIRTWFSPAEVKPLSETFAPITNLIAKFK